MKRVFALLTVAATGISGMGFAGASTAKNTASTHRPKSAQSPRAQATPRRYVAPADEYFGHLKMSYLGMANVVKDTGRKADANPENDGLVGSVSFLVDALRDWERKYPADPWLARTYFGVEQMFIKIRTPRGQQAALDTLRHIAGFYGGGPYGRFARAHLLALTPCVSESASPQPLLTSAPSPTPLPKGAVVIVPAPTPLPSPTPYPTPINAISKSPPQEPIQDPCVPSSPSPVPIRAYPTAAPGTQATANPAATPSPTPQRLPLATQSPGPGPSATATPMPSPSPSPH